MHGAIEVKTGLEHKDSNTPSPYYALCYVHLFFRAANGSFRPVAAARLLASGFDPLQTVGG